LRGKRKMIDFNYDGFILEINFTFEVWRIKEFFWRIINYFSLRLGRDWYWIDCGYCTRRKGEMVCGTSMNYGKPCHKKECIAVFGDDGDSE
jgi:hypothetical protein